MAASKKIDLKVKVGSGATPSAVVPPATVTGPVDVVVTFLDANGNPVPGISEANATSTLTSDNPDVTFTQKTPLSYGGKIAVGPSGTNGTANLTLVASVTNPPAGPFTATCAVTLAIPAPPTPGAVDVTFTITPSP